MALPSHSHGTSTRDVLCHALMITSTHYSEQMREKKQGTEEEELNETIIKSSIESISWSSSLVKLSLCDVILGEESTSTLTASSGAAGKMSDAIPLRANMLGRQLDEK
jgi:hypothetical protein